MPLTIIELVDQEDEEFNCPFCGHKLYPPEYPYCKHTVFVYAETSCDDFYDFITPSFAAPYLEKLKLTDWWYDDGYDELNGEDIADFRNGKIGKLNEQKITRLDTDLLDEGIFPQDKKVICYILKFDGYYPGEAYYCLEES